MKKNKFLIGLFSVAIIATVFYACQKEQTPGVSSTNTNEENVMQKSAASVLAPLNEHFIIINSKNEATEVTVSRGKDGVAIINTNGGRIQSNKPLEAFRYNVFDGKMTFEPSDRIIYLDMLQIGIKEWYIDFEKNPVFTARIIGGERKCYSCDCNKLSNTGGSSSCSWKTDPKNSLKGICTESTTGSCSGGVCGLNPATCPIVGSGGKDETIQNGSSHATFIAIEGRKIIINGKIFE